jgi:hypothetical protein
MHGGPTWRNQAPQHTEKMKPIQKSATLLVGQYVESILYSRGRGIIYEISGEQTPETVLSIAKHGVFATGGSAMISVAFPSGRSRMIPESIIRGVQWTIFDRIATPAEVENLVAQAIAAEEAAKAEEQRQETNRKNRLAGQLAEFAGWLEPLPGSKKSDHALGAANIRKELKKAFPGVKFKVTSDSFSGGNSIDIRWTAGPTVREVESITAKYQEGSFNGMEDIYENNRANTWPDAFGGAKYVQEHRDMSPGSHKVVCEALRAHYDAVTDWDLERIASEILHATSYPISDVEITGVERWENPGTGPNFRATYSTADEPAPVQIAVEASPPEELTAAQAADTFDFLTLDPVHLTDCAAGFLDQLHDKLEDDNRHSENLILLALRYGSPEQVDEARRIFREHEKAGELAPELSRERWALYEKLSAGETEQTAEPLVDSTPAQAAALTPESMRETLSECFVALLGIAGNDKLALPPEGRLSYEKLAWKALAHSQP